MFSQRKLSESCDIIIHQKLVYTKEVKRARRVLMVEGRSACTRAGGRDGGKKVVFVVWREGKKGVPAGGREGGREGERDKG